MYAFLIERIHQVLQGFFKRLARASYVEAHVALASVAKHLAVVESEVSVVNEEFTELFALQVRIGAVEPEKEGSLRTHDADFRQVLCNEVLGKADLGAQYTDGTGKTVTLEDFMDGGKCIIAVLGAGEEPTNHVLNDISVFKEDFEKSGMKILMVFADGENARRFKASDFPRLPGNIELGTDMDGSVKASLLDGAGSSRSALPVVGVIDAGGDITFLSSGYMIGIGERLLRDFPDESGQ